MEGPVPRDPIYLRFTAGFCDRPGTSRQTGSAVASHIQSTMYRIASVGGWLRMLLLAHTCEIHSSTRWLLAEGGSERCKHMVPWLIACGHVSLLCDFGEDAPLLQKSKPLYSSYESQVIDICEKAREISPAPGSQDDLFLETVQSNHDQNVNDAACLRIGQHGRNKYMTHF